MTRIEQAKRLSKFADIIEQMEWDLKGMQIDLSEGNKHPISNPFFNEKETKEKIENQICAIVEMKKEYEITKLICDYD